MNPDRPPGWPASLEFRRAAVRDLAWLVLDGAIVPSPGGSVPAPGEWPPPVLLDPDERAELRLLLQQWDEDSADGWLGPLPQQLRLGIRVERLIGAWLDASRRIDRLAMNWPLRVAGRTLGEVDFLVRRQAGRELWEVAFKVYLGVPGVGWVGPGLNDSLAGKLARIVTQQLKRVEQPAFQAAWGSGWGARAWVTGWLLAPLAADRPMAMPDAGRPPAFWVEVGSVGSAESRRPVRPERDPAIAAAARLGAVCGVDRWRPLSRNGWLRPVSGDAPDAGGGCGSLAALAAVSDRLPLLLAGVDTSTRERLRLMLVPSGWTAAARVRFAGQDLDSPGAGRAEWPISDSESKTR